jgi:hypothetical protein
MAVFQPFPGVWMENMVYMRCTTNHYFVYTPRKASLLKSGILKEDLPKESKPSACYLSYTRL